MKTSVYDGKRDGRGSQFMVVAGEQDTHSRERAEQIARHQPDEPKFPIEASEIAISDSPDHVILPSQPHRGSQGGESARVWLRPLSVINFSSRLGLARQTSKDHPAISTPTHRVSVTIISQPFQS